MAQQCRDLSSVLGPLDTTHLMNTMKRLRDALQDITYQNAYLVMNNNELTLENSFMTSTQKEVIKKIKAEQSHYYMQQRTTPHYIEAYPQATVVFQRYDLQQRPCATYIDTEDLLREVDEVLRTKGNKRDNLALTPATDNTADTTAPSTAGRGKGKRSGNTLPRDRPGNNKYPRTEDTPTQGNSSSESYSTGKGKSSNSSAWYTMSNNNLYFEPTDGSPGWYHHGNPKGKGKGKGKNYSDGHRYNGNITGTGAQTPSNVPSLTTSPIQFFTLIELEFPCSAGDGFKSVPFKTPTTNRYMHEPIRVIPAKAWLKPRLDLPETLITDEHQRVYLNALECIRLVIQSPYERVIQDRDTGGWINCEGKFVLPHDKHLYSKPHPLPLELDRYGDLVRVLRYRPTVHISSVSNQKSWNIYRTISIRGVS